MKNILFVVNEIFKLIFKIESFQRQSLSDSRDLQKIIPVRQTYSTLIIKFFFIYIFSKNHRRNLLFRHTNAFDFRPLRVTRFEMMTANVWCVFATPSGKRQDRRDTTFVVVTTTHNDSRRTFAPRDLSSVVFFFSLRTYYCTLYFPADERFSSAEASNSADENFACTRRWWISYFECNLRAIRLGRDDVSNLR